MGGHEGVRNPHGPHDPSAGETEQSENDMGGQHEGDDAANEGRMGPGWLSLTESSDGIDRDEGRDSTEAV